MKLVAVCALLVAFACSESKSSPPPAPTPSTETTSDAAPAGRQIPISVDGTQIAVVPQSRLEQPVELASLIDLPPAEWKVVEGYSTEFRRLPLRKPLKEYPDQKVMLFTDEHGKVCFGTFLDEAKASPEQQKLLGRPRLFVRDIKEVRIRTKEEKVDAAPSAVLEVAIGDKVSKLSAEELAKLEPASPTGGSRQPSWRLRDIIRLVTKRAPKQVVVSAESGDLTIPGSALRSDKHSIVVKLNRRGLYKLTWEDHTREPGKLAGEVRGLVRVSISYK